MTPEPSMHPGWTLVRNAKRRPFRGWAVQPEHAPGEDSVGCLSNELQEELSEVLTDLIELLVPRRDARMPQDHRILRIGRSFGSIDRHVVAIASAVDDDQ